MRTIRPVVEREDMTFTWHTSWNPVCIVLGEKPLISLLTGAVSARIPPAVEEIAPLAAAAAAVAGGLGGRGAVIDNPEFTEGVDAHRDLIEVGIVSDAVEVRPIGVDARRPLAGGVAPDVADGLELVRAALLGEDRGDHIFAVVDVDQLGMLGDFAVIRLGFIVFLDEVVPDVPFPHDLTGRLSRRLHLDDAVGQHETEAGQFRPASGGDGFLGGLLFSKDHQHVTIGQLADIVVRKLLVAGKSEVPDKLAIPGEFLNPPTGAGDVG